MITAWPADVPADALCDAAQRWGAPLYVYDLDAVAAQAKALRQALSPEIQIFYALKANPNLAICALLQSLGFAADVSSEGELAVALAAGMRPKDIIFTGPAKCDRMLASLAAHRPSWVVVESLNEAERLNRALTGSLPQDILLRVSLPVAFDPDDGIGVAPPGSRFGVDSADLVEVASICDKLENLRLRGLQSYAYSNRLQPAALIHHAQSLANEFRKLCELGFSLDTLDIGGGLGVPYGPDDQRLDLTEFGRLLKDVERHFAKSVALANENSRLEPRLLMEIGRYLVAEAGWYVVQVLDVRNKPGRSWAITDGGLHNLFRQSNARANNAAFLLSDGSGRPRATTRITGCLPTPQDVLVENFDGPALQVGDLIVFPTCGAYAYHHALAGFGLHPRPPEIGLAQDKLSLLRRRGDPAADLRDQCAGAATDPFTQPKAS